jgi:zinc transport system substrate-binding protein
MRIVVMKSSSSTRLRAAAAVALLTPLLAACGDPFGGGAEAGTGPRVVASFYPLQYVAERVAGEHAQVTSLTSPGVEPHDLELSVEQTATLADADLVLYEKGMQPAVDEAVQQNGPDEAIETTEVSPLEETGDHAGEESPDEHADETAEEHAEHAHEDGDPHFWLDPLKLAEVGDTLGERMAEVDPDHAEAYRANAADLRDDLAALDEEYTSTLDDCARDTVVVSHDAFGYLERYGLHFEAIAGLSPDAEPSPAHLAELQDLIEREGITTVFSETLASPAMARTIASDLGLDTGVLDPVEGLGDETAQEDYLSLMRQNLAALQEANQCR